LRIALCPDRVVVARVGLGWRGNVLDKRIVDCAPATVDQTWQTPLAALRAILDEHKKPNTSATVILSNHFVRYAIVPWRDSIANVAEQTALARHCFKNIYGDVAATWNVKVSDGGFRRNALASAVDRELLIQLKQIFTERKVSLSSVQPYFMTACNRFRRELAAGKSGCLSVLERGRATLGVFDRSGWQTLTTRRLADVSQTSLAPLLAQEINSANLAVTPEQLFVAALEDPKADFTDRAWTTQALRLKARRGFSPFEDARYAMALCGVA
jgi:hypothetical protein